MQASRYTLEVAVKIIIKYKQVEIINKLFTKLQRGYNAAQHQMQNPQQQPNHALKKKNRYSE